MEIWEAPRQTGPAPGHHKRHHQKDKHAPPDPEAAFPHIPEQTCDWAQGELPVHSCTQNRGQYLDPDQLLDLLAEEEDSTS